MKKKIDEVSKTLDDINRKRVEYGFPEIPISKLIKNKSYKESVQDVSMGGLKEETEPEDDKKEASSDDSTDTSTNTFYEKDEDAIEKKEDSDNYKALDEKEVPLVRYLNLDDVPLPQDPEPRNKKKIFDSLILPELRNINNRKDANPTPKVDNPLPQPTVTKTSLPAGTPPPMHAGMLPPMHAGMLPPMHAGMLPPMHAGMLPFMHTGIPPPMYAGMPPPMHAGMPPPMHAGMPPPMHAGMPYMPTSMSFIPTNVPFMPSSVPMPMPVGMQMVPPHRMPVAPQFSFGQRMPISCPYQHIPQPLQQDRAHFINKQQQNTVKKPASKLVALEGAPKVRDLLGEVAKIVPSSVLKRKIMINDDASRQRDEHSKITMTCTKTKIDLSAYKNAVEFENKQQPSTKSIKSDTTPASASDEYKKFMASMSDLFGTN